MGTDVLKESDFPGLRLVKRGKVRDVYKVDDKLLIVASDRVSAFDVVMGEPIPDKGKLLTSISLFWFRKTNLCKNKIFTNIIIFLRNIYLKIF